MLADHIQVRVEVSHLRREVVRLTTNYQVEGLQMSYGSFEASLSLDGHCARVPLGSESGNYETVDDLSCVVRVGVVGAAF